MLDRAAGLLARSSTAFTAPEATEDLLLSVLHAVRLRGAVFYWVDAIAPWVAAAPAAAEIAGHMMLGAEQVIQFHVVADGSCWASVPGGGAERVEAGDIVIYPAGDAHVFCSAPGLPAEEGRTPPFRVRLGADGPIAARFVCGFLACDASPFNPLLRALPRMLRVPFAGGPTAELVHLAAVETAAPRPGGEALRARLAEMLFVEAVRTHLARLPAGAGGWLGGLRDPLVGRAMALLHARPALRWTLDGLAREVGSSRSALAERFTAFAGHPPMQYLARWRVQVAASRLARGGEKVAAIALDVGYESEAAFNRAFKRLTGVPPAAWRRARMPRVQRLD